MLINRLILGATPQRSILPSYTGPGPEELIGYYQDPIIQGRISGFYGEVASSELVDGGQLASMVGLSNGYLQNSDTAWLKFLLDGKTLFIPKKTIRRQITWEQLNNLDLVYGDEARGHCRKVEIKGHQFVIRLMKGANTDPVTSIRKEHPSDQAIESYGSEWNRLMFNVSASDSMLEERQYWANYTDVELSVVDINGMGTATWCQETIKSSPSRHLYRGFFSITGYHHDLMGSSYSNYGWRPVLELIS